jgi:predicted nuclease of predicted toxin-antitoxin system
MKFLIDECLHTSLVTVAHDAGHVCEHVNFLGFGGHKDWQLMARIRREDYTFVTNNRTDFTALYAKIPATQRIVTAPGCGAGGALPPRG